MKIENEKVGDADFVIALGSLGADGIVVRVGKKKAVRIVGA